MRKKNKKEKEKYDR